MNNLMKKARGIILFLSFVLATQLISQSVLLNKVGEINQMGNIDNVPRFLFIMNLVITIVTVLLVFFQSIVYKFLLYFFQFDKKITIFKSFSYMLRGYIPFILFTVICYAINGKEGINLFFTTTWFKVINLFVINVIYVYFVQQNLKFNIKQSFIFGAMVIFLNSLTLFLG
ncbi:hypothetical protein COI51_12780 [Bacillus toyonensis]|uniref:hypothetical protein n=1 Tax=Bacillus toyonensis TaxID=155322 RepID=UPI000BEFE602|nr:hypothetical protein [Bacillus toyonensis]PEM15272.1 hypothetical protein CN616_23250 [Bacillus toyonensis]PGB24850.1 hypothetical protein COM06_19605 [Bacillus toyonensis]PGC34663.1 hypothetical protein COM10_20355 [Bacillus toyonensis]PHF84376.1 hypothetical protein COI51_12780 [Bacillus toyonensis]PHF99853.1 hypothetical protein COI49_23355 [Bacillus toyonensis]